MTDTHTGMSIYGIEHAPDWVPIPLDPQARLRCRVCGAQSDYVKEFTSRKLEHDVATRR